MILGELCAYYDRLRSDPSSGIAPPGFAPQQISFGIVLSPDGTLVQIQDVRDTAGKRPHPVMMTVPESVIRSVNIAANYLWDNTGYVLGADAKGNAERATETFAAFVLRQHEIGDCIDDEGMHAMLAFLDAWQPSDAESLEGWDEIAGTNVVFRLAHEHRYLHERPALIDAWTRARDAADVTGELGDRATCLVTGQKTTIAQLHNKIKGVRDAQSSGASIVSFNLASSCSYGKDQGHNSPVGRDAAFAYTTALNHLLRYDSRQKVQIADATTVFWASRPSSVESFLGPIVDPGDPRFADLAATEEVGNYLRAIQRGRNPDCIDESVRFHILGLSPNASRIAVRFWHATEVGELNRSLGQHYADLEIVREFEDQPEFPSIRQLLIETAPLRKSENINPTLSASMMRSILVGAPYPSFLLGSVLNRIRADRQIGYYRAALIKAVLSRDARTKNRSMEVSIVLNETSTHQGYRMGRLFAVLEKAQQDAIPTAKSTIKDRYYGSASSTPGVVFPQLLRLSQHHLAKLEGGARLSKERLVQEISADIQSFPTHLPLVDQGMFALGYYHQRKELYTKNQPRNREMDGMTDNRKEE